MHRHRYHGLLAPNARLRAQVVAMGRGPPQGDFLLDQTLDHASRGALDLTEPDPIPEYEFDQSIPDDFTS
jgi:hypothetical protein